MYPTIRPLALAAVALLFSVVSLAQDCSLTFTTPQFQVQQEMNVLYGSGPLFDGGTQALRMNIFKPMGDGQTERPLIILVHGGGFFDGDRNDLNDLCYDLASMGWATATVSYRLDFHGTQLFYSPWAYDPAEVIRAAYRAQQDVRGAVRFMKARSAMDSTSTDNVMLMGFSAGAIASLHAGFVDNPSEKPAACGSIGNVNFWFSSYSRPDLGPIEGLMNLNGMSDQVLGIASCYGGLLDTAFVSSPLEPALYMYHQTGDPVVGCNHQQGLWGMPLGVGDNYPWLYGSCVTNDHIQTLAPDPDRYQYHQHTGSDHGLHDADAIYFEMAEFLRGLFCMAPLEVAARVVLEGPYDPATGLMSDALRTAALLPLSEPYSSLGYAFTGEGGGETVVASVFNITGNNAAVDWVIMELRDATDPTVVMASRSALLQRDGDVVDLDGISPVVFSVPGGNYHVALRHRNHLGAMTANSILFSDVLATVDLTLASTPTYGVAARASVPGAVPAEALWQGDVTFNGELKYTGMDNDRDPILQEIGGSIPTATTNGYLQEDVNLNGEVKYTGVGNDRDPILVNVGGSVPTNVRMEQLP